MSEKKKTHWIVDFITRMRPLGQLPGQVYLWLAVIIFGAANPVTRKLTEIGSQQFVNGENPISFCNVLFVGNLCALVVLVSLSWRQSDWHRLKQLSRQEWLSLTVVGILAGALAPALIFQALATTNVNNVVLIGRLDPPLTLALSAWWLGERFNRWELIGAIACVIGATLILLLQVSPPTPMVTMDGVGFGLGELLAAIAAILLPVATIIGKKYLSLVPLSLYNIYRTALGTVVFFIVALIVYGQDHFAEAFSPFLWQWMLVYGTVIVVCGQSFWLQGLRAAPLAAASLAGSFTPLAGILAAYLILGEVPTPAQYLGGSIIVLGIGLGQIGVRRHLASQTATGRVINRSEQMRTLENKIGFKGI